MEPLVKGLFYGELKASTTIMDKSKVIDLSQMNKFAFMLLVQYLAARGRFAYNLQQIFGFLLGVESH